MIALKNSKNSSESKNNVQYLFRENFIVKALCVILFLGITLQSNAQCSNMKDYNGMTATIAKGSTVGQSFTISADCASGDNEFEYFEINHQSPWNNTFTLKIYEGENYTGTPRFTKENISMQAGGANTKFRIDLAGGTGDLSFETGQTYTFTLTPHDSHFRWNGDNTNTQNNKALWPNNGGTWVDHFDYLYTVGTTQGGVTIYRNANYGGHSVNVGVGEYDANQLPAGLLNDQMRSFKVSSGYEVTVYQYSGYSGPSQVLIQDTPSVTMGVSSFKITKN